MVFTNRSMKDAPLMKRVRTDNQTKTLLIPAIETFKGIPVGMTYKYLGTILHSTLLITPQLLHIKKKSNHLFVKLYPYLQNASAEGRRDMWQTMISPLFNATMALLSAEPTKTGTNNVVLLWRKSFKQFMMLPKRTSTALVNEMMNKDIVHLSKIELLNNIIKWHSRMNSLEGSKHISILKSPNPLRGIPNSWCQLVKSQYQLCNTCLRKKKYRIASSWHRLYAHGQFVQPVFKIWKQDLLPENKDKIKRNLKLKKIKRIMAIHLNMTNEI